jgi:dihydrolipoamide dehydrogenase
MPPDGDTFDAIVIGAGSGGLTVAVGLAGFGRRVALVEANRVGGDCTNTGCIPSKRLIHLARDDAHAEPAAILADVRATRDGLSDIERHELRVNPNITLIDGHAQFVSATRVRVSDPTGDHLLTAPHVIVATGSRPRTITVPGLPAERLLTNETLFELPAAPAHLAIVGAGAIGVEMASAFRRIGTRVTLVDRAERVLPVALPEASAALHAALVDRGVDVVCRGRVIGYDPLARTLEVADPEGARYVADVDAVLVAIGRTPDTGALALANAGLAATPSGIVVDSWGRTAVRGIWAVGDVTGAHQTHAANALGRRIVQRIALPWLPPVTRAPVVPTAVFSDPEVAWVGLSPAALSRRCNGRVVIRIRVDLADTDRGLTDGLTRGFVIIDAVRLTGRILSATVVGPNASELIGIVTLAMARRTSLLRLSRLVYAYPTFAGAIGKVADEFARQTLGNLRGEASTYARYRLVGGDRKPH